MGATLIHQGQRTKVVTEAGPTVQMTYQVTNVTRPLNSASKICDQGSTVVNTWTWAVTPFSREYGVYMLHTWVPSP